MQSTRVRVQAGMVAVVAGLVAVCAATGSRASAQDTYQYEQAENWAQIPEGAKWGTMTAVDVDAEGTVYALQRGEPAKIMVFDSQGKFLRSWGEGLFEQAHGLRVDRQGNVWVTDRGSHQVVKFSPDGKALMTLGRKGVAGDNNSTDALNGPSDIVIAPNGELFVSDGESTNTRVVKFSKDGKFLTFWGTKGAGPGQLDVPHSIAMDSKGRLYVANRANKRIEVFDREGKYLDQITNAGTPYGLFMAKDDVLYVVDGTQGKAPSEDLTIIDTKNKSILGHIDGLLGPHMVSVNARGDIYVAEVRGTAVLKFVRKGLAEAATAAPSSAMPRNDLPQPYRTTRDWGQLPAGAAWAAVTAIEPAPNGTIYVVHRCFANSCAGRNEAPILKYDQSGKLLASWGQGMFDFPHGATTDRDSNLWLTDAPSGESGKGHQVVKFSPDGKVLMTLGQAGVSGSGPNLFDRPTDVVVAPDGTIFVTDSHRNGKNNRVVKFTRDGKFIKEWGARDRGAASSVSPTPSPWIRAAASSSAIARTIGSRSSTRKVRRSPNGVSSDGRAGSRSLPTTRSTWPIRSPVPTPALMNCPASRRAFALGARKTVPWPRSSRTGNRQPAITRGPKE